MQPIYEIAVQSIKPEHTESYPAVRAAFLDQLRGHAGVEQDWTFSSFFTMPEPDTTQVLLGVTRWSSAEHFAAASAALMPTETAQSLFSKVDMRAFVQVQPADGGVFNLEDHVRGPDTVIEVAVRKPKAGVAEGDYQAARDAFFGKCATLPGFLFDQEFVDGDGNRVVLIGWESTDAFQGALGALSQSAEMGAFFSLIDVQAYQATTLA